MSNSTATATVSATAKSKKHTFEVRVYRTFREVWDGESVYKDRSCERFSIRAGGDLSASKLAQELAGENSTQGGALLSAIDIYKVIDGVRASKTVFEEARSRARQYGGRRW